MAGGIDWFRWHHGSVTDPKFQLVARKAGASLPDVLAVWAYVLEKASAAEFRGCFGELDPEAIDCLFGFDDGTTDAILAAMVQRKLIADEYIVAWEKRQPKREDDTAAERKRRQREREHEMAIAACVTGGESRNVTHGHAEVTRGHDRGEESREEKKEDTHATQVEPVVPPTAAGRACLLLRKSGISGVSPGHPKLLALLAAGVTDEELTHAAQSAVSKGKGFAYAMGALEAQRREAAAMTLHAGPMPGKAVTVASDAAEKTAAMLAEQAARKAEPPSDAIREKLRAAKGVAALAGFAVKVAA